jgi:hypothetical protein
MGWSKGEALSSTKVQISTERDRFRRRASVVLGASAALGTGIRMQEIEPTPHTAKRRVASSRNCGCIVMGHLGRSAPVMDRL